MLETSVSACVASTRPDVKGTLTSLWPAAEAADSMAALPPRMRRSARETWRSLFLALKSDLMEFSWYYGQ